VPLLVQIVQGSNLCLARLFLLSEYVIEFPVLPGKCWHSIATCLLSQKRRPLLGNGSIKTLVAKKQLRNIEKWSNWEAVFFTRFVLTAT
jgi:hypothetical protein